MNHTDWAVGDVFEYVWSDCGALHERVGIVLNGLRVKTPFASKQSSSAYCSSNMKYLFTVVAKSDNVLMERAREQYKGDHQMF